MPKLRVAMKNALKPKTKKMPPEAISALTAAAKEAQEILSPPMPISAALGYDSATGRYYSDSEIWTSDILIENDYVPELTIEENLERNGWNVVDLWRKGKGFSIFSRHPEECDDPADVDYLLKISCSNHETHDVYIYEDEMVDVLEAVKYFAPAVDALLL